MCWLHKNWTGENLDLFCLQVIWNKSCTSLLGFRCLLSGRPRVLNDPQFCLSCETLKNLEVFFFFFKQLEQFYRERLTYSSSGSAVCPKVLLDSNTLCCRSSVSLCKANVKPHVYYDSCLYTVKSSCVQHLILTWLWWCYSWRFLGELWGLLVAPWCRLFSQGTNISLGHTHHLFPSLFRKK